MKAFKSLSGLAAPLMEKGRLMANVDTDMIIPKQFLKTTERTGLSKGLFYELKTRSDGSLNPDFILHQEAYSSAQILIAGENFGCGSSREHAPWALLDQGISAVIAPGFADIFYNNCFKNGVLPIALPSEHVEALARQAGGGNHIFNIDLESQTLTAPDGTAYHFEIDASRKHNLIEGLDEIALSLQKQSEISAFEAQRAISLPWLSS